MGLEIQGVTIKCPQDLREALDIEMTRDHFEFTVKAMIQRWGLDSALSMLSGALITSEEYGEGLLKPTYRQECNPHDVWDYWNVKIER